MKHLFVIIFLQIFLFGCQSTKKEEIVIEKNKDLFDAKVEFTICKMTFESLKGEVINLGKIIYPGLKFYEVYTCKSKKSEYVYLNRKNPFFVTTEVLIWENEKIIKPFYNFDNVGNVNISFQMKENSTAKIKIKNFVADVKHMSF